MASEGGANRESGCDKGKKAFGEDIQEHRCGWRFMPEELQSGSYVSGSDH
jgi:hypothetical protein